MNIYIERDYRSIIRKLIEEKKSKESRASFQDLAETIRVPKSYVSKVMNGKADFSADQIYLCANYFQLDEEESTYLEILVEIERSALLQRKKSLQQVIEKLRKPHLSTESNIDVEPTNQEDDMDQYYLEPLNLLIHQCLSIDRYRLTPKLLYRDLCFPKESIDRSIERLITLGIVKRLGDTYRVLKDNIHLSENNKIFPIWRNQMKTLTQAANFQTLKDQNRNFAAVVALNQEGRDFLVKSFFEFIGKVKNEVKPSSDDDVYQINFDLIKWTNRND